MGKQLAAGVRKRHRKYEVREEGHGEKRKGNEDGAFPGKGERGGGGKGTGKEQKRPPGAGIKGKEDGGFREKGAGGKARGKETEAKADCEEGKGKGKEKGDAAFPE